MQSHFLYYCTVHLFLFFFHVIFFSSFVFKHLSILFWWFFSVYIPNFSHLLLSAVFFLRCVMTILCSVMLFFSIPSSLSSLSLDNSRWLSWHPLSILDFCFGAIQRCCWGIYSISLCLCISLVFSISFCLTGLLYIKD